MKISILSTYPVDTSGSFTGPQRVIEGLFNELAKENDINLSLFVPTKMIYPFCKTERINKNTTLIRVTPIYIFFQKEFYNSDIVHINAVNPINAIECMLINLINYIKKKKVKVIYHAHGIIPNEIKFGYKYSISYRVSEKLLFKYSNKVILVSDLLYKTALQYYNSYSSKFVIINNGISYNKEFFKIKKLISSKSKILKILFVGNIEKIKGLDRIIQLMSELENSQLNIVGKIKDKPYFENILLKYNLLFKEKKVIYLGELKNNKLYDMYVSSDILVLPSLYDSYPSVVLESLMSGTPVIISNMVGTKDIIINGRNGYVFKDDKELKDILLKIQKNSELIKNMKKFATQTVKKEFWKYKIKELLEVYKK